MSAPRSPAWLEIDLDALGRNVSVLKERAGGARLAAVVKANGYGHGSVAVAEAALAAGAERVCVVSLDEAATLRRGGIRAPILVLGYVAPQEAERAVELDVAVTAPDDAVVGALAWAAGARGRVAPIHLELDAGMHRLGVGADDAARLASAVRAQPSLRLEGICTQFPSADGPDPEDTERRFERFLTVAARIAAPLRHVANTATLLRFPQMALELARPGLGLYGVEPWGGEAPWAGGFEPVLRWKARLVRIHHVPAGEGVSYGGRWTAARDARVGVLPVGYADGYRGGFGGRASGLIRGRRAPVVGAVCMDMCMVDLSEIPDAAVGDVAVLLGEQAGERITAEELAAASDTIPHEILAALGPRMPRVYLRGGRVVASQTMLDGAPAPAVASSAEALLASR